MLSRPSHTGLLAVAVGAGIAFSTGACEAPPSATPSAPPAPAEPATPTVVVLVTASSAGGTDLAVTIRDRIVTIAGAVPSIRTLGGDALAEALGRDPIEALRRCGGDVGCIASLAREVEGTRVVFGRVLDAPNGARVQLLATPAHEPALDGRAQFVLATLDGLQSALRPHFPSLFGAALPESAGGEPARFDEPLTADAVARCVERSGEVEVRRPEALAWSPLKVGDVLRAGDLVRAGSTAAARLRYASGAEIDLGSGAVVAIEARAEGDDPEAAPERVAVRAGTVRGVVDGKGADLLLQTPDGNWVRLAREGRERAAYRVQVREGGAMQVSLREGRAVLVGAGGERADLAAGAARELDGTTLGEAVPLPDFPSLLAPGVDANLTLEPDLSVELEWSRVASVDDYLLQVATDPSFLHLELDTVVTGTSHRFPVSAEANFYWRVAARDATGRDGEYGFARRLFVTPERIQNLLVAPAPEAEVVMDGPGPHFITFSWRAAVPPAPYTLIVTTDPELGEEPALTVTTTVQEVMTRQLRSGSYYWGVYVNRRGRQRPIFQNPRRLTLLASNP